jgi:hypothetical protein
MESSRGKGERLESGEASREALGVCYRGHRDATTWQGEVLAAAHGGHVHATRPPLGHFPEHVAGSGLGIVERDFGPDLGQIGQWANCQSCSPRYTLQISFKHHGHKIHRLGDN